LSRTLHYRITVIVKSNYRHCKKLGTAAVQKCVLKKKEAGSEVRRHSIGATKIMSDCCGVRFLWRRV
jgi:hypothetical protein